MIFSWYIHRSVRWRLCMCAVTLPRMHGVMHKCFLWSPHRNKSYTLHRLIRWAFPVDFRGVVRSFLAAISTHNVVRANENGCDRSAGQASGFGLTGLSLIECFEFIICSCGECFTQRGQKLKSIHLLFKYHKRCFN